MPTVSTAGVTNRLHRTARSDAFNMLWLACSYFLFSNSSVLYAVTTRTHVRISRKLEQTTE